MEKGLLATGLLILLGATMYLNTTDTSNEIDLANQYTQWKVKYNKRYTNQRDEMYRFKIFVDNVKMIQAFNESPEVKTYTLAINQFGDLTSEEFARTYLNLRVPKGASNKDVEANYVPYGESSNWIAAGKVPPVKDQGQCGSSWAFAAIGSIEINNDIQFNEAVNLSEQDLVDCSDSYGNFGCNGGYMTTSFQYAQENGLALGGAYPYTGKYQACKTTIKRPYKNVAGYVEISDCNTLRQAVLKGSVAVAADAMNWSFYAGGVLSNCSTNYNHPVVIVGVDDNGVWTARNEWGSNWGENGNIRLAAGNTCGICDLASYPILKQ